MNNCHNPGETLKPLRFREASPETASRRPCRGTRCSVTEVSTREFLQQIHLSASDSLEPLVTKDNQPVPTARLVLIRPDGDPSYFCVSATSAREYSGREIEVDMTRFASYKGVFTVRERHTSEAEAIDSVTRGREQASQSRAMCLSWQLGSPMRQIRDRLAGVWGPHSVVRSTPIHSPVFADRHQQRRGNQPDAAQATPRALMLLGHRSHVLSAARLPSGAVLPQYEGIDNNAGG